MDKKDLFAGKPMLPPIGGGSVGAPEGGQGLWAINPDSKVPAAQAFASDLAKSGLAPEDIGAYLASDIECAAVGIRPHMVVAPEGNKVVSSPGYVIPYYDIYGKKVPFYRVKLFNPIPQGPKYLQPPGSPSYLYYPRQFHQLLTGIAEGKESPSVINGFNPLVIMTEGEKKTARLAKEGYLSVGVGGVFNWRNRTLLLPKDTKVDQDERSGKIRVKLPSSVELDLDDMSAATGSSTLAEGMTELIHLILKSGMYLVVLFDADFPENLHVQTAAAQLGFELRFKGIPTIKIRQVKMPTNGKNKIGVDDYLQEHGPAALQELVEKCLHSRCSFPAHPNMRAYVSSRMSGKLYRDKVRETAIAMITDLDSKGFRMKEAGSDIPYFFDQESRTLMRVILQSQTGEPLHETQFGEYLYRQYDVSQADHLLMHWIAASYTGEDPIEIVKPYSALATLPDGKVAFQLSDGQFILVSAEGLALCDNGTHGVLFRSNQVAPINGNRMLSRIREMMAEPLENWWAQIYGQFKFVRPTDRDLASILSYISPWLLRWKGSQLPVEIMVGEAGSGKSSAYSLRTAILTGRPSLKNQPVFIRDWYSGIVSSPGLYVLDNVHFTNKEMRQRLSDEMCRLVTEPDPHVEMRKLYTTADNVWMPVRCSFVITAIQQPFFNADILQRSIVLDLEAVGKDHDSAWVEHALAKFGGRERWVAHHLVTLHKFMRLAKDEWDDHFKSGHRLANFEQLVYMMSRVLMGKAERPLDIAPTLHTKMAEQAGEYDWSMQALKDFALEELAACRRDPNHVFSAQDIADWAQARDEYMANQIVTNGRKLGRYLTSHKFMVESYAHIVCVGVQQNRQVYRVVSEK